MESGQLVLVTLQNPRDKFWSLMLSLDPAAVNVHAVDLRCQDDLTLLVKSSDAVSATVEFLPMHRVQRIEETIATESCRQFRANTGVDVRKFFEEPRK